jgi:hypothetical protein
MDDCTSIFLPGGLESARKVEPLLNSSLLKGRSLYQAAAVRINNAQGFHLTYRKLDSSFEFDHNTECYIYGRQYNDSIQICARNVDDSIAVGM